MHSAGCGWRASACRSLIVVVVPVTCHTPSTPLTNKRVAIPINHSHSTRFEYEMNEGKKEWKKKKQKTVKFNLNLNRSITKWSLPEVDSSTTATATAQYVCIQSDICNMPEGVDYVEILECASAAYRIRYQNFDNDSNTEDKKQSERFCSQQTAKQKKEKRKTKMNFSISKPITFCRD